MPEPTVPHLQAAREPQVLPLTFGGELSISEHDGDYSLRIDVDGGHFAIRLSALDAWGLRDLTSHIVRGRAAEFAATLEQPSDPPPYTGDEPLGTCPTHGDYWTDECIRCSWGKGS